jgi:hypothetical protein
MECTAFAYGGFDAVGVDDSQAIMYCDPMAVDFSPEPDLDFLCFEYRILKRYNMLDYIDDDRKSRALTAFGTSTTGGGSSWDDLERRQFRTTNNHFESYGASQPSISQDHYGRNHFVSSTQKRQRR